MSKSIASIGLIIFITLYQIFTANCSEYSYGVVESCSGCSLNRLPDVKKFIFSDVPNYERVQFKHIQGAVPELVLYNNNEEEVERLQLSRLTRDECNELLQQKGFKKITIKDEI